MQSNFSIWARTVLIETLLHSAILWLSWEKVCFMHHPKHGLEKLFHFSGVCFSSPRVSSKSLHYFWNQSRLPGTGLSFESITPRLHQKPQGNTEGHKENERVPSYSLFYRAVLCSCTETARLREYSEFALSTNVMWIIECSLKRTAFLYGKDIYMKWPNICGHLCPHAFVFFWSVSWFKSRRGNLNATAYSTIVF